jgi:type VI secretion system protein ImpG
MDSRYYQDELNYLRTLGAEYAGRYKGAEQLLGKNAYDPDVERLLQGFAFLSARLHERLDDQYSQVAEGFLSVMWPQVLRPIPSTTMVQFSPDRQVLRRNYTLSRGIELQSKRYSWGQYKFQTSRDVDLYPFILVEAGLEARGEKSLLKLVFELNPGTSLEESELGQLPIFISGSDPRFTYGWYLWLTQYLREAYLVSDSSEVTKKVTVSPVGFDDVTLFPDSDDEIPGHRILREFFAFPENFLFIQIDDISSLRDMSVDSRFEIFFDFGHRIPSGPLRDIADDSFRLFCTPAVNLFRSGSRIRLDQTRSEYRVLADEAGGVEHNEIYTINSVEGIEQGPGGRSIKYRSFHDRDLTMGGPDKAVPSFRVRYSDIHMTVDDRPLRGRECFISFDDPSADVRKTDVQSVSIDLTCTHRGGAPALRIGELCQAGEQLPAFVRLSNIRVPSPQRDAPLSPKNLWRLVSSFTMFGKAITNIENLKAVLAFHSRVESDSDSTGEKWLNGLRNLDVRPGITAAGGTPLRTLGITFTFDCESDRIPEFYLFGVVLSEFLRHVATINSRLNFTMLFEHNRDQRFTWQQRTGTCAAL